MHTPDTLKKQLIKFNGQHSLIGLLDIPEPERYRGEPIHKLERLFGITEVDVQKPQAETKQSAFGNACRTGEFPGDTVEFGRESGDGFLVQCRARAVNHLIYPGIIPGFKSLYQLLQHLMPGITVFPQPLQHRSPVQVAETKEEIDVGLEHYCFITGAAQHLLQLMPDDESQDLRLICGG